MATIKIIVRKEKGKIKTNSKGETLIFIQYGHSGKTILFSSEMRINPQFLKWDEKDLDQRNPIKKSLVGFTTKISNIKKIANEIDEIKDKLINQNIYPSTEEVRRVFDSRRNTSPIKKGFFQLFDDFIEESKPTKASGTVKHYRTVYNHLMKYSTLKKEVIAIDKIDIRFYDRFMNYLLEEVELPDESKGMKNNTVGSVIKNIKLFLGYLSKRGYQVNPDYKNFKTLKEKPTVIYLTQDELAKLSDHDFSDNLKLERSRDIWVLQAATGLRYSDLSRLGKEHIEGNMIRMKAHKTKKDIKVPLTPVSSKILSKYNYELPIISEQKQNIFIKEACELAKINAIIEVAVYRGGKKSYEKYFKHKLISTHKAVSTFITHCGERGISPKVVSEITGKTVKVILDHYYGTNDKVIEMEMQRAFGVPEANLKVV
jgi:integrase